MFRALILVLALVFPLRAKDPLDAARIDAIVESQIKAHKAVGIALAVVTTEQTYTHGYGLRSLETRQPVTARTIFAAGSLTKSFTALGAAMLADDGKLDWDKPMREYLPWFKLYDPHATELATIRDLLTHRSGLPRYDFLRFAVPLPREEIVRRLRYLPPTASFRERYQYQNLMYTAAGYLTGVLNGSSWEELIERRIFAPLEMRNSTVRVAETRARQDYASGHELVGGALRPVGFYDYQKFGVGPNGAVNTSAEDMAKYVKFHMGDGTAGGKHLVSKRQLDELHRPQMVIDETSSYALGWSVTWTPGFKVVSHSGSIVGFRAFAAFAPARGEAVAVLANSPVNAAAIAMALAEQILGWHPQRERSAQERTTPGAKPAQALQGPPARPLSAYAGRYEHPAFGACEIVESGGRLAANFPAVSLALDHVRFDVFRAEPPMDGGPRSQIKMQFVMDPDGEFAELRMRLEPAAPPLSFRRLRN